MTLDDLKQLIRSIPDFPKPGIDFKDITTLLQHPGGFGEAVNLFARRYEDRKIDAVVAAEARGFIFGGALAYKLGCGFVPVRKKGKLPYLTYEQTYDLEYGTDTIAIHQDALKDGDRVVVCDDLLATGGTVAAIVDLLHNFKIEMVEIAFLIELTFLNGRDKLPGLPVYAALSF